jgi:hypothetical protein
MQIIVESDSSIVVRLIEVGCHVQHHANSFVYSIRRLVAELSQSNVIHILPEVNDVADAFPCAGHGLD